MNTAANPTIELENRYCAKNYHPLPVVLVRGKGVWLWDDAGQRYLDMMGAYSAVSHGHCHPRLVQALHHQAETLSVVSRAFHTNTLAPFLEKACKLTGMEKALPMNSGAEAVETALKAARKWAYLVKGVPENQAEIIVCEGNFHGRTIAIVGMSTEHQYKHGFGPFPGGAKFIPYGDASALEKAITSNTAALLLEPIQGEAGIRIPPAGYLKQCAEICKKHRILFIADEIQSGLCRTGKWFACQHENVQPDGLILGKALGGGILPVSLFLSKKEVMDVFQPGDHGSTFGGNALSAAVALEALKIMEEDDYCQRSTELGSYMLDKLKGIKSKVIYDLRGKGLFIGLEINPAIATAREVCLKLMARGILSKDTHGTVVRLAPPLIIEKSEIDWAVEIIKEILGEYEK